MNFSPKTRLLLTVILVLCLPLQSTQFDVDEETLEQIGNHQDDSAISKWWKMIVEMVQNNWRESEAQHEHND
ncbi:unnamed protein product, partial [Iphiclides podalirius]